VSPAIRALAGALALAASTNAAPRSVPKAQHAVNLRAKIVSGNPQTARAYVALAAPKYLSEFPDLLVVAVDAPALEGQKRAVRFHCVTKGCALVAADQPDPNLIHIIDAATREAEIENGRASIRISIEAARAGGT
jgi:hypothetical protein